MNQRNSRAHLREGQFLDWFIALYTEILQVNVFIYVLAKCSTTSLYFRGFASALLANWSLRIVKKQPFSRGCSCHLKMFPADSAPNGAYFGKLKSSHVPSRQSKQQSAEANRLINNDSFRSVPKYDKLQIYHIIWRAIRKTVTYATFASTRQRPGIRIFIALQIDQLH